jgi:hypothetical protein
MFRKPPKEIIVISTQFRNVKKEEEEKGLVLQPTCVFDLIMDVFYILSYVDRYTDYLWLFIGIFIFKIIWNNMAIYWNIHIYMKNPKPKAL